MMPDSPLLELIGEKPSRQRHSDVPALACCECVNRNRAFQPAPKRRDERDVGSNLRPAVGLVRTIVGLHFGQPTLGRVGEWKTFSTGRRILVTATSRSS